MEYGIISCIPITVLIVGVLITKRMPEMIFASSLIGAILVHKSISLPVTLECCMVLFPIPHINSY